jgi:hypothetical protein
MRASAAETVVLKRTAMANDMAVPVRLLSRYCAIRARVFRGFKSRQSFMREIWSGTRKQLCGSVHTRFDQSVALRHKAGFGISFRSMFDTLENDTLF